MRIIIIIIILLVLVYLFRKGLRENFSSLNILQYPDQDIKTHERWIKYHANDTLLKKRDIIRYLNLLKNEIKLLFYSSAYDNIMKAHNNIEITERRNFIATEFLKFLRRFVQNSDPTEPVIVVNVGNDETRIASFNTENFQKLTNHLLEYIRCNSSNGEACSNYKYTEKQAKHFKNSMLKEYDLVNNLDLIYKYFVERDINNLSRLIYKILEKFYVYENPEYKPDTELPCVIYDDKTCPKGENDKCDWNYSDNLCIPKENDGSNIFQYNNPIEDCNAISNYGQNYCNRTYTYDENEKKYKKCKYQLKTHKCLNPSENAEDDNIKCEDILGSGEDFKSNCDNLAKCDYLKKTLTNSDGKEETYEFCIDKNEATNSKFNPMTCINFTSILDHKVTTPVEFNGNDENDVEILKKYQCKTTEDDGSEVKYYYNPSLIPKAQAENLECGIFDNSNYLRNRNNTEFVKKQHNEKYRIQNIGKQKAFCEGIKEKDSNNSKCKFIEFNYYNNKPLTKCIPKKMNVSSNFIPDDDEDTCNFLGYDYIGTLNKKKCIDIDGKCNDIKYKNVCNEKDNTCFWNPGLSKTSDNRNDKFERGYCMNLDTISFEQVIDKYHNDEIEKIAKFRNLEAEFKRLNTDKEILDLLQKKH